LLVGCLVHVVSYKHCFLVGFGFDCMVFNVVGVLVWVVLMCSVLCGLSIAWGGGY